ncbi:50S ribosomal protein L25/general stress protein Ctc [Parachlamydia sp. AcF125]|uniref:50S ribosomal protein L25/general stress protein Ctc n=1 Tax=Parachlamydia sp. AcF125 TaxID=2795736 RepID=UPI001BCA456D|nr:50S ribosomal protein L25/general stress protein Ctc [Parachlamydia sp. AcF125]MBS4168336.1 General stress protein CTC [Parachlamydia sp. AcF125]
MKLKAFKRNVEKKCSVKKLRREGKIPAVIYKKGSSGEELSIDGQMFTAALRKVEPGHLSTTVFILEEEGRAERQVIVKEIQYNVTNYDVIHLDFEELIEGTPVNVKIPIEIVGAADCPGIKLGGVPRQVIRAMKVRCLPKDIPASFPVDISTLSLGESKRLSDLQIANTIRPLMNLSEVAVAIVKR